MKLIWKLVNNLVHIIVTWGDNLILSHDRMSEEMLESYPCVPLN